MIYNTGITRHRLLTMGHHVHCFLWHSLAHCSHLWQSMWWMYVSRLCELPFTVPLAQYVQHQCAKQAVICSAQLPDAMKPYDLLLMQHIAWNHAISIGWMFPCWVTCNPALSIDSDKLLKYKPSYQISPIRNLKLLTFLYLSSSPFYPLFLIILANKPSITTNWSPSTLYNIPFKSVSI